MDTGIGIPSGGYIMSDPDLRFEIYKDWVSLRSEGTGLNPAVFARRKGIKPETLESIVREFKSYDPTGERWGKLI